MLPIQSHFEVFPGYPSRLRLFLPSLHHDHCKGNKEKECREVVGSYHAPAAAACHAPSGTGVGSSGVTEDPGIQRLASGTLWRYRYSSFSPFQQDENEYPSHKSESGVTMGILLSFSNPIASQCSASPQTSFVSRG